MRQYRDLLRLTHARVLKRTLKCGRCSNRALGHQCAIALVIKLMTFGVDATSLIVYRATESELKDDVAVLPDGSNSGNLSYA